MEQECTFLIAILSKKLNLKDLIDVIESTAITTAMIFLVLLGAEFFNSFIALTQLPNQLSQLVLENNLSPFLIVAYILIIYLLVGCLMDSLAMIIVNYSYIFSINYKS